jgi:hypothetical protein
MPQHSFRRFAVSAVVVLTVATAAAVPAAKTVLVTVLASPDGPVTGLTASDVSVREDKTPLEVTGVQRAEDPLFVTLLVDVTTPATVNPPTQDIRRSLRTFFATIRAGAPDTQFAVYQVANAATPLTGFTDDPVKLEEAVGHLVSGAQSGSVMLEGVMRAAREMSEKPSPRRAVIGISFGSAEAGSERAPTVAEVVTKSGVTLWAVAIQGPGDTQSAAREDVWTRLTVASGGLLIGLVDVSGLEPQLKTVANSLLSQYSVTFTRKSDGAIKPLTGQTANGRRVLFSHWMR